MPTARVRTRATTAKLHTLCSLVSLWLLASTLTLAAAASSTSSRSTNLFKRLRGSQIAPGVSPAGDDYWCRVEGECLPCPPGARNSDVCKIYGNRRPLICVPRHATNTGHASPASPVSGAFDNAGLEADADADPDSSEGDDEKEKNKNTNDDDDAPPKLKPKPPVMKPLVEPAGSQAEADDLARQNSETFRNAAAGAAGGADEIEAGAKAGLSQADQELQDELQAERRQRRARARARGLADSSVARRRRRRQGPISTWEACPKVLHSEHHDYFEFILCNAGFAAVAIAVLVFRQRTLALQQFARLAARIMQTQAV